MAATHPERVLSVVYGGQAPLIAGPGAKSSGSSEVEIFAKAVDEGKDLGSYIIAVTPPGKPKPTEELAKAIAKFMYDGKDVKAFAAAGRSFKNLEVTEEQLKKCKAPDPVHPRRERIRLREGQRCRRPQAARPRRGQDHRGRGPHHHAHQTGVRVRAYGVSADR